MNIADDLTKTYNIADELKKIVKTSSLLLYFNAILQSQHIKIELTLQSKLHLKSRRKSLKKDQRCQQKCSLENPNPIHVGFFFQV